MKLKASNYLKILNTISDGVACHQVVLDKNGEPRDFIFVDANDAFAEMFSKGKRELKGKNLSSFLADFDDSGFNWQEHYISLFHKKKKKKAHMNNHFRGRWYAITIYREDNDLFFTIFRDITSLRESREQLGNILDSMDEVVWSASLPDLSITYVSPSAEQIFGRKATDYVDIQTIWKEMVYEEDRVYIAEMLQNLKEEGKAEVECRILNAQKELVWIIARVKIIYDFHNKPVRLDGIITSIDERKKAEEAIQESEKRYRTLITNVPGAIFRCVNDEHWTMEYISDVIEEISGFIAGDFTDNKVRSFRSIIHQEDAEKVKTELTEKLRKNHYYNISYRIKDSENNTRWVAERAQGIFDDKGNLLYIDGIIFDVTERRLAEKALLEAEQKYRHTLDNMMEGAQIIGFDWRYKYVNETAAAHGKRKKEELLGKTMMECFPGIEETEMFKILKLCMKDRKHYHMESEFHTMDGDSRFYELSIQADPEGVFILSLDITERKAAEEELLKTSKELEDFFSLTLDLLCIADLKGNFIKVNRSWEDVLGYAREELEKKNILDFVHPDDLASTKDLLERLSNRERIMNFINRYRSSGGYYHFIEWRIYPREETIYIAARDITDRVLYEEQLKYQSFHDTLTGIYNRAYFEEEIRRLQGGREYPITVFSVDVDGLKLINDALGHSQGDEILRKSADIIKNMLRSSDVFSRIGGDEFSIILPHTDKKSGELVMRRIKSKIREYNKDNPELPISISMGSFTADDPGYTLEEVFKKADNRMYRAKLKKGSSARKQITESLINSLDQKDYISGGHAQRIEFLCIKAAESLKLHTKAVKNLKMLARVHDIGKVGIDENIIFKEGQLTKEEWTQMRQHSEIGYRIATSAPELTKVADFILKHHERWDGSGYPLKYKGEEIPLECRLFSIAEAYEVMTTGRPYKKPISMDNALKELKKQSGKQFDPQLTELFVEVISKL